MPKPGYYYYENRRALQGILVMGVIALGFYLAKNGPSLEQKVSDYFTDNLLETILGAILFLMFLWVVRKVQLWFIEPRPSRYKSRADFEQALSRYGARKGYKPGWVYYRSQELWRE